MASTISSGNGGTISFGTNTTFTASWLTIGGMTQSREALETSHLGTSVYRSFIPGDLINPGSSEVEYLYNVDSEQPPVNDPAEEITITFPNTSGAATPGKIVANGFLTDFTTPEISNDQVMTGSFIIKWTDGPIVNDAADFVDEVP